MTDSAVDKTVLITGITSDIGKEIAIRFAENGWNIIGHYYSAAEEARKIGMLLKQFAVQFHSYQVDFSSENEVERFIKKLRKIGIDSVVNNAGTYLVNKHFSQLSFSEINKTFMVNVFTPLMLTSTIFLRMQEKKFGRIVNISSIAAKYGGSSRSLHYGCSKRAIEGLTKTLAREGAAYNVFANTIRPGVIDTDFHKKFPKDMNKRIAMIPLKRMGSPRDVAEMAYFLGSEKNNFITNEIITVAGGE